MSRFTVVFFLILALSISSCSNKEILLPQIPISGISEIQNHSQLWVFYKEKDGKIEADLNINNKITTTHWIINIDKRLTLKELVPVFKTIKEKREKKSIHSIEGMNNYLTYSDIKNKKIALFAMDSIYFMTLSKEKMETLKQENDSFSIIEFSAENILLNSKSFSANKWDSMILDTLSKSNLQLVFSEELSYQKYLEYRLKIQNKLSEDIHVNSLEYVLD